MAKDRGMKLDVVEGSVPGQRFDDSQSFPLVYECRSTHATLDDAAAWISTEAAELVQQAALCGVVMFRGFPLITDRDFDRFVAAFGLPNFKYEDCLSNAVRVVKTDRVFTANEAPPDVRIFLHHEMAQTPVYPSKLFFFCEKPADEGGATPMCRSDILFDRITQECPQFAQDCRTKGLRYSHVMPAANDSASGMGRSWQSTLRSETPQQAEARLQSLGYTWKWLHDGCLRVTTPVLPAVRQLASGRTAFFNQLIAAFHGWKDARNDPANAITFGDGTRLDTAVMQQVIEMAEALTFDTPWQAGDVALVDNYVAMHGRRPFKGTRKVLASLIAS
jgi:hypothetical protein